MCIRDSIIYRRQREDMPADKTEIAEAEREGIKIHFLTVPVKMIGKDGKLTNMECVRMSLGEFDRSGRRRPVEIEASNFVVDEMCIRDRRCNVLRVVFAEA